MKDQVKITIAEGEIKNKKVWQIPTMEVISRDNVQSGDTNGVEGVVFNPNSTGQTS